MIVFLILISIVTVLGIILSVISFRECETEAGFGVLVIMILFNVILLVPILAIDTHSGMTVGTITSVDRNFFGSTAIYVKTSETEQEKYCAEDKEIIEKAKELINKKVKISYGTRVGIYPLKKCHEAPIDIIEEIENE